MHRRRLEGTQVEMNQPNPAAQERNALRATIAQQQTLIQNQANQIGFLRHTIAKADLAIDYIARLAGVSEQIQGIRTKADAANPAQPIPDPPGTAPSETTEQAATPEAYDNPMVPGQTPGSVQHLPADATGTPMDPGTTLSTAPYNQLVDVTAPIEGTQTHVPNDQTRTEVDVRVGDPMNPERAFPWNPNVGPDAMGAQASAQQRTAAQVQNRTLASISLARLRIAANIAQGSDLEVAGTIEANASLSDADIAKEIEILSQVHTASVQNGSQRPASAVPQRAASTQVARTAPSLVSAPSQPMQTMASASSVDGDLENADLFD